MPGTTNLSLCSKKTAGVEGVLFYNWYGLTDGTTTFLLEPGAAVDFDSNLAVQSNHLVFVFPTYADQLKKGEKF